MNILDDILQILPVTECILFALVLLWTGVKKRKPWLFHLSVFFILLGSFYFMSHGFYLRRTELMVFSFVLSLPVTLSVMPSYYIYLRAITRVSGMRKSTRLLHYFPALMMLFLLFPFFTLPVEVSREFVNGTLVNPEDYAVLSLIRPIYRIGVLGLINIQLVVYLVLMFNEVRRCKRAYRGDFGQGEHTQLDWINYSLLFFSLLFFLITFSHHLGVGRFEFSRIVFNSISCLILVYLFVKGLQQPNVYSEKGMLNPGS